MRARCGRMNSPLVLNMRSTGAEVAGEQKTSKSARKTLNAGFRLATVHNSLDSSSRFTNARRRCLIFHMLRYTTQSSKIFEDLNFRGWGQGQGLENWSLRILEDKDVPRGQQHWIFGSRGCKVLSDSYCQYRRVERYPSNPTNVTPPTRVSLFYDAARCKTGVGQFLKSWNLSNFDRTAVVPNASSPRVLSRMSWFLTLCSTIVYA